MTSKILLDVSAGSGLGVVNDMSPEGTLILNVLIILGRVAIEVIQARKERRRKRKEQNP